MCSIYHCLSLIDCRAQITFTVICFVLPDITNCRPYRVLKRVKRFYGKLHFTMTIRKPQIWRGDICNLTFEKQNLLLKEFCKSVQICQSYDETPIQVSCFFLTRGVHVFVVNIRDSISGSRQRFPLCL